MHQVGYILSGNSGARLVGSSKLRKFVALDVKLTVPKRYVWLRNPENLSQR